MPQMEFQCEVSGKILAKLHETYITSMNLESTYRAQRLPCFVPGRTHYYLACLAFQGRDREFDEVINPPEHPRHAAFLYREAHI